MPSTYSPDLRVELIANGEKTGTWGTITNSNLGTILEDAISGLATVSIISSAQALTVQDGSPDEARNAAVTVTTTTTANFSVFVPPVTKLYTFTNASAYVATVYASTVAGNTTAAGTGVAIPAGKSILVRCDGTNIVDQLNHVVGALGVGGNLAVGGTLAVTGTGAFTGAVSGPTAAPGTNTTQLATTAFVNAALIASYPIGSVYTSTVSTNPATLFGFGTWVAFGAGRVLIGDGGGFAAGATGGSANAVIVSHTHTATVTDPGHLHTFGSGGGSGPPYYPTIEVDGNGTRLYNSLTDTATTGISVANSTAGVSGTNANLQPYIVVYMWNRTA
jgi:hypothetical protein